MSTTDWSRLLAPTLVLMVSCASVAHTWNPDEVLRDVLTHGYRFNGPQRKAAIEDVAARDGSGTAIILKRIAGIKSSHEPEHELADLLAIEAALIALTHMQDPSATELNRQHFNDDWLRGVVLINLIELKAWVATSDVETWFATAPLRPEQMHVIAEAARFLSLSPRATSASCAGIQRVRSTFPCLSSSDNYRCMNLDGSLITLERHLRCFYESGRGVVVPTCQGRQIELASATGEQGHAWSSGSSFV